MPTKQMHIITFEFYGGVPEELRKDPDDPTSGIAEMVDTPPEVIAARRVRQAEQMGRKTLVATSYGNEVELHTGKSLESLRGKTVNIEALFALMDQAVMPYWCRVAKTKDGCRFAIMFRPMLPGTKTVPFDKAEALIAKLREVEKMRIMGCWLNEPHPSVIEQGETDCQHFNLVLDAKGCQKVNAPKPDEMAFAFSEADDRVIITTKYLGAVKSFGTTVTVTEVKEGVAAIVAEKAEAGTLPTPASKIKPHYRHPGGKQ